MTAIRPYDPASDAEALWELKRAFELELGGSEGGEDHRERGEKARAYREKLTPTYRERYLEWVERCVADEERAVLLAVDGGEAVGYAFVLPERLAFVWDAAVLNELFVRGAYRGTRLADDLMDRVVDVARGQDLPLPRLLLDVSADNERARSFYARRGFESWGELLARDLG